MGEAVQLDGTVANKLQKSKDKCARVTNTLKTQGQRTLSKWTKKLHGQGMNYAFSTWKKQTQNLKHREKLFCSIKAQMTKHTLRNALNRWKDTKAGFTMEMSTTMIVEEERGIAQEAHNISKTNEARKIHADRSARQMATI